MRTYNGSFHDLKVECKIEMDSDEEETFVTIGTPLEIIDEDAPKKKPTSFQDLPVKDKQGRVRFHGAFTGGFSAGYFNSVGTKDGWTPSTFVSSREKRDDAKSQRPEDFMDEEDFGEHGIAPRKHHISDTYSSEVKKRQRIQEANAATTGTILSGTPALADLIVPEKLSVGIKLLRKLGWKEGQGIGPRRERKKKKDSSRNKDKSSVKVYSCVLPSKDSDSNSEESSEDELISSVTFAPKDTTQISLVAKDNVHGIGYRGIDPRMALPGTHVNLFAPPPISKSGRKAIRGHAFGVGALEEDDYDIYATDHLSNYDITMGGEEEQEDLYGWTAPGRGKTKGNRAPPVGYVGKLLEGFTLSSEPLKKKKSFSPPSLPKDYRPSCRFLKRIETSTGHVTSQNHQGKQKVQDAISRGLLLGETPILMSVFDLVSKEDKGKMQAVRSGPEAAKSGPEADTSGPEADTSGPEAAKSGAEAATEPLTHKFHVSTQVAAQTGMETVVKAVSGSDSRLNDAKAKSSGSRGDQKTSSQIEQQTLPLFRGSESLFKPFSKDLKKQERYDRYQALIKQGVRDAYTEVAEGHMTEWERKREEEEFIKAARLYKPMSGMIASRFTRAKFHDDDETVEMPAEEGGDKNDREKAAEMKMYGQLTRSMSDWYPDKVLCKRFNVPDPYPGITLVGVPKVKRDKFSVFNFLSFAGSEEKVPEAPLALPASDLPGESNGNTGLGNKSKSSEQVSFKISNKNRPAIGQSIFSSLMDDATSKKEKVPSLNETPVTTTEAASLKTAEQTSTAESAIAEKDDDDKPAMDLFEAIFGNTDSEESAESEHDDSAEIKRDSPPAQTPKSDDSNTHVQLTTTQESFLPGAPVAIDSLARRLSVPTKDGAHHRESDPEEYGPALPPTLPTSGSSAATYTGGISGVVDLTKSSHRKHKERHKHKHKKEKSSKHKKSKHKKKEKKKEKKKKRKYSDSEDSDSDSQSDSETDRKLNREILNKLSSISDGNRLTAADFM